MSEWKETRLGKLIEINPETLSVSKYTGEIKYIDIASVNTGSLEGYTTYEISDAPSRARRIIKDKDIIFSTVRPNLRAYYFVKNAPPNAICSTGFAVLRAKKGVNSRFIYSLVTENSFVDYLALVAKGSAYPAVDTNDFKKAKVTVPDLPTQDRIADILSAYDDLIEANNRRIELLEQAAQELYKEWFVRFRFPGYEKTKFENGLPEGWERNKIQKYYQTCSGGTPSRSKPEYFENGIYPWVKTGEIKDCVIIDTEEYITQDAVNRSSSKVLPAKSVAMAMYGVNIGLLAYFGSEMTCNQACCVFSDKRDFSSKHYLYYYLKSIREYLLLISFGAAQQNLSQDLIKKIKITMPSDDVVQAFEKQIDDIYDSIRMLLMKNKNLAEQRDMLLPRLMSGELGV